MEKLSYEIQINATPEKIWSVLWGEITYRQWTAVFAEGSFYQGNLEEGSIVKFLDPNNNGMFSKVEKNVPNKEIRFLHLGEIVAGVEAPQEWGEATESYFLKETDEGTSLKCEIQTPEEFKGFFEEKFPKALEIIKNLSQNQL
ncbi:SRPBCC domain-containing protein [Chryseobacterium sp. PTM-20240506]|uniref:SRPBCC domain-containing protein n=1 Tax=unclassified Chryseobacterium TaxID=2593645 RepID=UPI001557D09D|nr:MULTISPECIES: SRPBCC domain-containing protein [unclassified Chryseobacterium]MDC8104379.1 SRPBCC domain-containing protein [Chryseobacterium sp. B21-037]MDQ1803993.1 SRPBCC domain-containing protein [Chryseobacterium sp. CKR4-1]WBV57911.1 SRPBCC domain-containing protein [Chryseobacterium daecheongense]